MGRHRPPPPPARPPAHRWRPLPVLAIMTAVLAVITAAGWLQAITTAGTRAGVHAGTTAATPQGPATPGVRP